MLTLVGTRAATPPSYPAYRPFAVAVQRILPLSPHLVRVTFAGADLAVFGTTGLDQRIKLVLPFPDGSLCDVGADDDRGRREGTWYARWRETCPRSARNPFRTYTVRGDPPRAARARRRHGAPRPRARCDRRPRRGLAAPGRRRRRRHRRRPGRTHAPTRPSGATGARARPPRSARRRRDGGARDLLDHRVAEPGGHRAGVHRGAIERRHPEPRAPRALPRRVARPRRRVRDRRRASRPLLPHGELLRAGRARLAAPALAQLPRSCGRTPKRVEDVDVDTELLWDSPARPGDGRLLRVDRRRGRRPSRPCAVTS